MLTAHDMSTSLMQACSETKRKYSCFTRVSRNPNTKDLPLLESSNLTRIVAVLVVGHWVATESLLLCLKALTRAERFCIGELVCN